MISRTKWFHFSSYYQKLLSDLLESGKCLFCETGSVSRLCQFKAGGFKFIPRDNNGPFMSIGWMHQETKSWIHTIHRTLIFYIFQYWQRYFSNAAIGGFNIILKKACRYKLSLLLHVFIASINPNRYRSHVIIVVLFIGIKFVKTIVNITKKT